ncbi:MAG: TlpA disulfide reductase family protein [Rhodanobacter sp.]
MANALAVVTVGPLALSAGVIALLAGVIVAFAIDGWFRRHRRVSAESALWLSLLLALVVARVVFVLRWWPEYVVQPSSMLNLRDAGFSALSGLLALVVSTVLIAWRRPSWRKSLTWSVCGGVLVWGFITLTVQRLENATRLPLPEITLRDLAGHPVALRELRGQPTVINLWATWCAPCRREMPVLETAQRRMPGVRFVFANQGESANATSAFLDAQKLQLEHVVLDANMQLSQYYNMRGYPSTLFLDAQGHVRDAHMGELSAATLAASLAHVTVSSPADSGESP